MRSPSTALLPLPLPPPLSLLFLTLLLLLLSQQKPAAAKYTVTEKEMANTLKAQGVFGPLFHLLNETPEAPKYEERPLFETAMTIREQQQTPHSMRQQRNASIRMIIYGAWVGNTPHDVERLNQQLYCTHWGYEYKYFHMNKTGWDAAHPGVSPLWYKVFAVRDMLKENLADYYVYLDIDCLFAR
jgi:hypothetical protein